MWRSRCLRLQSAFSVCYWECKVRCPAGAPQRNLNGIGWHPEQSLYTEGSHTVWVRVGKYQYGSCLPISAAHLEDVSVHMKNDPNLQTLNKVIAVGWPSDKHEVPEEAVHYFHFRDELSEQDGIISCGNQAVIPSTLRRTMLEWIHSAHIGIEGYLRRARECLYWLSMRSAVKDYVDKCSIYHSFDSKKAKETLHSHQVPSRPWVKIGTDLFSCNDLNYLITVDYYSGFWKVDALPDTASCTVINKLKAHFACYGILDVYPSDNGPQFQSV